MSITDFPLKNPASPETESAGKRTAIRDRCVAHRAVRRVVSPAQPETRHCPNLKMDCA